MKFRNLAGSEEVTRQSTARYEFFSLEFELEDGSTMVPWIEVRPVGEVNRPYINAVLAQQAKNRRRLTKGKIDARMLEENRDQDRELYPKFVLTGNWAAGSTTPPGKRSPTPKRLPASCCPSFRSTSSTS